MKPDKHKQKRQSEYKRKHGIQAKIEKTNNSIPGVKTVDVSKKDLLPKPGLTESEVHEQEAPGCSSKSHNYEPEPQNPLDIEECESLEELDDILRDTANTLFQYQYQQASFFDEIGNYPKLSDWCSDIVSVCPNLMANILLGIPLYERLDLEESIFEPEDMMRMQTEAGKRANKIFPSTQLRISCDDISSQEAEDLFNMIPANVIRKRWNHALLNSEFSNGNTSHSSNTTSHYQNSSKANPSTTDISEGVSATPKQYLRTPINSIQDSRKVTIAELEDELDALLNL